MRSGYRHGSAADPDRGGTARCALTPPPLSVSRPRCGCWELQLLRLLARLTAPGCNVDGQQAGGAHGSAAAHRCDGTDAARIHHSITLHPPPLSLNLSTTTTALNVDHPLYSLSILSPPSSSLPPPSTSPPSTMNRLYIGTGLLWLCVLLFVLCGTLLSTAAGIPHFAVAPDGTFDIGAFKVVSVDGGLSLETSIDSDCAFNLEGFGEGLFRSSNSACTRFNAFRSLLIIAIVTDFLIALALYSCLLKQWLPPCATRPVSSLRHWVLSFCCVVAIAANAAALILMSYMIANDIVTDVESGVSWRLLLAALPICVVASMVLVIDCQLCHQWQVKHSGQGTTDTTAKSLEEGTNPPSVQLTRVEV